MAKKNRNEEAAGDAAVSVQGTHEETDGPIGEGIIIGGGEPPTGDETDLAEESESYLDGHPRPCSLCTNERPCSPECAKTVGLDLDDDAFILRFGEPLRVTFAREFLHETLSPTHCPLCGAPYSTADGCMVSKCVLHADNRSHVEGRIRARVIDPVHTAMGRHEPGFEGSFSLDDVLSAPHCFEALE